LSSVLLPFIVASRASAHESKSTRARAGAGESTVQGARRWIARCYNKDVAYKTTKTKRGEKMSEGISDLKELSKMMRRT
jgi:hypothetical protein